VRFKVLTATSMKMAVFRDVASCSLVGVHGTRRSDDGGSKRLRNVGELYETTRRTTIQMTSIFILAAMRT
jgi:hypothetical protein